MSEAQFGNIFDLDNYTDAVSDAFDAIHDAGDTIGAILKGISPALAFIPGIGTALSVGIYAAGAISAKDRITDAVIGTASAAMPPGLPRIAFDGASNITVDIADGKNAFGSAVDAMRKCAATSGPQAEAAFDAALNMARGGKIDSRLIAEAKANFANGGKTAEMAFDAGIAVAEGKSADQVVLDVARNYIRDAGGPLAAAAFDTGVAMGYGQTLQEAGWAGLHTLVRGNNPVEMIINFVQQVGMSKAAGIAFPIFLENGLVRDATNSIRGGVGNLAPDFTKVKNALAPHVEWFQKNLPALDIPSGELAQQWGVDEAIVRTAQSLVDRATGAIDQALLDKFNVGDAPGTKERNDAYEKDGQKICTEVFQLGRRRSLEQFTRSPGWLRGFDIGAAVSYQKAGIGAGQAAVRDSLQTQDQYDGFMAAANMNYSMGSISATNNVAAIVALANPNDVSVRTATAKTSGAIAMGLGRNITREERDMLDNYAAKGKAIAKQVPVVAALRDLSSDPRYLFGFDIATAGCQGKTGTGEGQEHVKALIGPIYLGGGPTDGTPGSNEAMAGFTAAQALQYGLSKKFGGLTPGVMAGQLVVDGLTNTGMTSDQKAGVVALTQSNAAVGAGAAAQVQENTGFFHKLAVFFGLAA